MENSRVFVAFDISMLFYCFSLIACGDASKVTTYRSPDSEQSRDFIAQSAGTSGSDRIGFAGVGGTHQNGGTGAVQSGSGGSTSIAQSGSGGSDGSTLDAQSGSGGSGVDAQPISSCNNSVIDGSETDIDCGGTCGGCEPGASCRVDSDCDRGPCEDNTCGCTPLTSCPSSDCGTLDDGCGGQIECDDCPDEEQICYQNSCCTPATCSDSDGCGSLDDGCGEQIDCGCESPQVCYQGSCCTPLTCDDIDDTDDGCDTLDNGCGEQIVCGCDDEQACYRGSCCNPLTDCSENACGHIEDDCGGALDCGGCSDANWCGGGGIANECGCTGPDSVCSCVGDDCCIIGEDPADSDEDGVIDCLDACPQDDARSDVSECCGEAATPDSDSDGFPDCDEEADGLDWTDKDVFNGVHVELRRQCEFSPSCQAYDTLREIRTCLSTETISQSLDQYSGWDWNNPIIDYPNYEGYNFQPNWADFPTMSNWQIYAAGFINLADDGYHCFAITGSNNEACASLYFVDTPARDFSGWDSLDGDTSAVAQHESGTQCFNLSAGVYPIFWHYDMDNGSSSDFHLLYCYQSDAECTPYTALPSRMLRVDP